MGQGMGQEGLSETVYANGDTDRDGRETAFGFRPSNVRKVVLTGGVSGGKTTFIGVARKRLAELGYVVYIINETATEQLTNGITEAEDFDSLMFQRFVTEETIWKERFYERVAATRSRERRIVIICDRGVLDGKAFLNDDETFEAILSEYGMTTQNALEAYDGVIHLVTAADGARQFYGGNNPVRREDVDGALWVDRQCRRVWMSHPRWVCIGNDGVDFDGKLDEAFGALLEICQGIAPCS